MHLTNGQHVPDFQVEDIYGNPVHLADYRGKPILLSFYRFATCPFCNFRMRELMKRYPAYQAQGLSMIVFWQSPREEILRDIDQQTAPFPIIADPERKIYKLYGVETSWRGLLRLMNHPRYAIKAMRQSNLLKVLADRGSKTLMPADFLLNTDLTIQQAYYGQHPGDHISFEAIEAFLGQTPLVVEPDEAIILQG